MQDKAEMKKQVLVLGIILLITIVLAIILNMNGNSKNKYIQNDNTNSNTSVTLESEMYNNLKGLIEENEVKETLNTEGSQNLKPNSEEKVQYKEMEFETY